jgi:hypothetical protein
LLPPFFGEIAMNFRSFLHVALLGLAGIVQANAAELTLNKSTMDRLKSLQTGEPFSLDGFPVGPADNRAVRFHRVEVYAPDARLFVIGADGKHELPRSSRIYLRGYAQDGSARVAMSLNADGSFAEGTGSGTQGPFVLNASVEASGSHTLRARTLQSTLPSPDAFQFRCSNENQKLDIGVSNDVAAQLHAAVTQSSSQTSALSTYRLATIGVDTDSLFMTRLFANNTATATNWIASLFNFMNTMYENDLQVQLVIGTTILRTSAASDPYTSFTSLQGVSTAELDTFGSYWKAHEGSVPRSFAILLSGQIASTASSCGAAGKAWINQYCQKGFASGADTVGSYSVTKVCTSLGIDPDASFDALIVGHEIGHNFGAYHTHCTNASTGAAPTATNTIDTCYNQEASSGCYAGPTSCPAGGSGTIMSYCNFTSVSTCASGTQNQAAFHSTQITQVLLPNVSANTPSCLQTDEIFQNGFN